MKRSQGTSPRIGRVGDAEDRMSVDDQDAVYDYENYEDEYYDGSQASDSGKKRKRGGNIFSLTVPVSPKFATAARIKNNALSSEQIERQRFEMEQEELHRQRELAEQRKLKALMSEPYMPARSIKPLTEPVEFHFSTTDRAMQRHAFEVTDAEMEAPAAKRSKPAPQLPENGITVPEPFHFTVEERAALKRHRKPKFSSESAESAGEEAEHYEQHQEYIPLAQQLKRIEKATPDRWKRNPKRTNSPRGPREITIPQDFHFETDVRIAMRPPSPTREEPKPEPFRARPLNKKIFESSGEIGVPRVEKRQPTIPESPQFAVKQRAALRRNPAPEEVKAMEEEELRQAREFKAGPITHYAFRSGNHHDRYLPTIPQSPALSTKERAQMRPQAEEVVHKEKISHEFKARPMKVVEQPFVPKLGEVHLTEPIPFDLATERRRIEEEQKLQQKIEDERRQLEAAREFKARPLPKKALQNPFKPQLDLKVTEPEPFQLVSLQKHEVYQELFHEKISEEERARREAMEFKARAFKQAKPFIPQRSTKPLTTLDDVVLNSDVRASQRREFDNKLMAKEIAQQEAERKRQILEQERQKQEIKKLRQQLVHKPLPVPETMYKVGFMPKPSDQPLTAPKTPIFGLDKKRRRMVGRDL